MKHIRLPRRGLYAKAAALAALLLTAACGNDTGGMNHGNTGSTGTPTGSAGTVNDADVTFAQNMIPHHRQAVEMGTMAAEKASDPEIKQLAAQIKAAQDPEIATLTGWLSAWGKPTAPATGHEGMSMPGMMSDAEMNQLKAASGTDFDRMFAQMMIAHHNGAIQMAKDEQAKGANTAAKGLAATIERTQSAEIAQLQKILDRL
jgi:uncharacterized protein (DUF305 family)